MDRGTACARRWDRCWILSRTTSGIADSRNEWWMDVLENGPSSDYAPYFDIDWEPLKIDLRDKVLLPILGDQYGRVLERGELQVRFEEGTFYLLYGERRLPIAPGTYRYILEIALENLAGIQGRRFLRGIAKHSDCARIFAETHRNRPEAHRRTRARKGNHQTAAGASLRRSAASAKGDRKSSGADQRKARATRAVLTSWMNCSTRSRIAWPFGASLPKKSITAAFST